MPGLGCVDSMLMSASSERRALGYAFASSVWFDLLDPMA
jgi:hypothetical protein